MLAEFTPPLSSGLIVARSPHASSPHRPHAQSAACLAPIQAVAQLMPYLVKGRQARDTQQPKESSQYVQVYSVRS